MTFWVIFLANSHNSGKNGLKMFVCCSLLCIYNGLEANWSMSVVYLRYCSPAIRTNKVFESRWFEISTSCNIMLNFNSAVPVLKQYEDSYLLGEVLVVCMIFLMYRCIDPG